MLHYRGLEQLAARWAHNPEVLGSSPRPATGLRPKGLRPASTKYMSCVVYILKCSDGSFYTGLTKNLKRRFKEHENGLSVCTKGKLPVKLVLAVLFPNKNIAAKFEQYLKSHSGIAFRNKHLVYTAKRSGAVR